MINKKLIEKYTFKLNENWNKQGNEIKLHGRVENDITVVVSSTEKRQKKVFFNELSSKLITKIKNKLPKDKLLKINYELPYKNSTYWARIDGEIQLIDETKALLDYFVPMIKFIENEKLKTKYLIEAELVYKGWE